MAVITVSVKPSVKPGGDEDIKEYIGLSTDTKPVTCGDESTFTELDTKKMFRYSEGNVNPATTNGWWEM